MKRIYIILLLLFATVIVFAQNTILSSFTAKSDGKDVTLQWNTTDESDISHFEIERAALKSTFKYLATEKAHGYASSYTFTDDNVFNKEDGQDHTLSSNFMYRIKIVHKNNKFEYSNYVNVVHNISGIQKTWGMIKEMFR
jgi:multidrug efflux pump subunit AcrB